MSIPLIDFRAQYANLKDEIDDAIGDVISRASFVQRQEVTILEREFAEYCSVSEAVGVSSGVEALQLSLVALGIGAGDEVITTPLSFVSTAEAISQVGAKPVFVDVDSVSSNIDANKIEAAITSQTKAIIPVHLNGYPANMEQICYIGKIHNVKVIENASHALGARFNGQMVGTFGVVGCFAMSPDSNFGAFGDAGMVVTNEAPIAYRIRMLRDHGRSARNGTYEHTEIGFSSRMDAIQAAVLRVKMPHIDEWLCRRRQIAAKYCELLANLGLILPPDQVNVEPSLHRFVIRTPHRGQWRRRLKSEGVDTGVHFPIPTHLQPAYRHLGYQVGDFPVAESIAREVLSLPMYPELTNEEIHMVAECFGTGAEAPYGSSTTPERVSNDSYRKLMEVKGNSNVSF